MPWLFYAYMHISVCTHKKKNLPIHVSLTALRLEGLNCFLVTPEYLYHVQMKAVILNIFSWKGFLNAFLFSLIIQLFQQDKINIYIKYTVVK